MISDGNPFEFEAMLAKAVGTGKRLVASAAGAAHALTGYPPEGTRLEGELQYLVRPTKEQLERHRSRFEPAGTTARDQRRAHNAAVDAVAEAYGLNESASDEQVLELRGKGLSVAAIVEQTGLPHARVRALVRGASRPSKSTPGGR